MSSINVTKPIPRDPNHVPALSGISAVDLTTQIPIEADPVTGSLFVTVIASTTGSTTLLNGQVTVTTAGTRVQLSVASVALYNGVIVRAKDTNTGYIYLGNSAVSSSTGMILLAGESTSVAVDNLNKLYIDSSVSGSDISYIGS